ncbi:alpha-2-macroglobulin family protein [Prevotella sp. E2-28]|uniref:alpha-2-macroglobulin family protein n=1 Tax=Prevotella sp. E2-28 TaxID=2913620 RepID=UPI001ED9E2AE|nr:alpha-2-macroglobulin family protein [Prevotella sp. E2-28]UKK53231.1 MG2 domain-containing protein [Prevotella sp. E2-28]
MKRLFLMIALMVPMLVSAQGFDALWKQVEKAENDDLPKTEQEVLTRIVKKAENEKAYGQLLKAELKRMKVAIEVAPDSLMPEVQRLQEREQAAKDAALRAVYQTVLGLVHDQNRQHITDAEQKAEDYKNKAMANPDMLASVKIDAYEPFVERGEDSRVFNHELLGLLGMQTKHYDVMRLYYKKAGNRPAALLSSLAWLKQQRPREMEKLEESVYIPRLDSLMNEYSDLAEAGEVAIERYDYMHRMTDATPQQEWEFLDEALNRWGRWPRMNYMRNELSALKSLQFHASLTDAVGLPMTPQKVKLANLRGVGKMTMRVYRVNLPAIDLQDVNVDRDKGYKVVRNHLAALPEKTVERTYTGKAPYETYDDEMTLDGLPVGVYMLEFESSPGTDRVARSLYFVSNLRVLVQQFPNEVMHYVVVNATTGQPVKDATIRIRVDNADVTLTSDAKGECKYAAVNHYKSFHVMTSDDKACPAMDPYGYFSYYDNHRHVRHAEIFTDRAIYRPGQTVYMSAILYQTENGFQNSVEKGKKVTAVLFDANHDEVATKELVTDDYGTCTTSFTLPQKGLTGSFSVCIDGKCRYFQVEEYKRPTFEVEIPTVKENYGSGDTLQVKGTARSYAGVPVQGAKVKYKVERQHAFWWVSYYRYWNQTYIEENNETEKLAEGEVMTDADGTFTVPAPITVPKTRYPMFYNFVITADVTDQAGETRHGELSLPLGNRKTAFSVDMSDKMLSESNEGLMFHLRNAAGTDLDEEVRYRFTQEGKRSQDWQTARTNLFVAIAKLKSGKYEVEAICGEDTLKQDFVVFSLNDKRPAVKTDDWFYVSETQFRNDGTPVTVQVGSSAEDVHMIYSIISGKKVLESGAVNQSNALWNKKFTYREEYGNGILLTFAWMKQGKAYTHDVNIKRPVPDNKLSLKWETFRNRLEPGQQEEWTLTVAGPDEKPVTAQLMATMYDKSLDQLAANSWTLQPYLWLPTSSTRWRACSWGSVYCSGTRSEKYLNVNQLNYDRFDSSVFPVYRLYREMAIGAAFSANRGVMYDSMNERVLKVAEKAVDEEHEFAGMAMDIVNEGNPHDTGGARGETAPQVRENLNETAFFYPQLMTDSVGRVTVKFTLPESLTTWRFLGLAHTQDMMTGTLTGEAVAKKNVMILPNVPRFIRVGDKATISGRIFNTSEKNIAGKARLELLDPETNQTVFATERRVSVAPDSVLAVSFAYNAANETRNLLVMRMMVSGDDFSDGEQHYLPVLPNQERVTLTVPFTQNAPATKTIDISVLKDKTNSQLTVEYTNNPAWLMIQALPSVGHPHDDCAICQAASYYANAIGRHILLQNWQVKNVFKAWSSEESENSSLKSQLSKNGELKDLLLNETPWVADANSEHEQKARLSDFFDANLMNSRQDESLRKLGDLQQSDGSWSWWKGMQGSLYMTVEVSEMLVRLNQMTGKQEQTEQMLGRAFNFMGKEMVKFVDEMKEQEKRGIKPVFPSHKALQWLYICTLDGRKLPSDVQSANDYLIKLLKKETRNQSIYDKAMSAIILNNKTYVKSLKEFTVYREDMGRYYDTKRALYSWRNYRIPTQVAAIEAIKRLTPEDTKTIEEMQRWLLQEKRTQAWDTPVNSADAIYAFLNGNSKMLEAQPKSVLKVDGQELHTSQATAGIGYVKTTIAGDGKQTFTVEKTSTGTSWGAVYMQFMQPTSEIETQNGGIKVKREMIGNKDLKVGDKITVRIIIEADRDYDFVQVVDKRAACMEPVNQLSGYHWGYYTAPKDCSTNYYFDMFAKGKHVIETEYYIDRAGTYETGTCTASCAYSPEFRGVAKSQTIEVK